MNTTLAATDATLSTTLITMNTAITAPWIEDDDLFSSAQQRILQITSVITGSVSIVGSSWIIYKILTAPAAQNNRTSSTSAPAGSKLSLDSLRRSVYHRLMFGLSSMDILFSIGNVGFSSWSIPAEVDYVFNAAGSWASCEAGAFFTNFMLGTTLYSAYLAIYFVLLVRYNVKEEWMARKVEPFFHATAILFPLVTAPIAIANNYFNPLRTVPGTCWFDDYPPTCSTTEGLECIRGDGYKPLALVSGAMSVFFSLVISVTCMVLLVLKVRQTELQMKQYAGGQNAPLLLTKRTTIQALLYIGAYFLTYFALVILQFMELPETRENRSVYFAVGLMCKIFTPLQGAFNAGVFWYRSANPSASRRRGTTTAASSRVSSKKPFSKKTTLPNSTCSEVREQAGQVETSTDVSNFSQVI